MAYTMERDSRRDRGQWRGCHTFKNIICDGDDPSRRVPRSGGLKMGNAYYYYYELDGSTETHDPAVPSTTACPYLPGQCVNTLWVPLEQSGRERCASVGSVDDSDYQTMDPADRFVTPRLPATTSAVRKAAVEPETAMPPPRAASPNIYQPQPPRSAPNACALSTSTWSARRLFSRRPSPARNAAGVEDSYHGSAINEPQQPPPTTATATTVRALISWASYSSLSSLRRPAPPPSLHSIRSTSSSQAGSRSRDMSPDSLRRFLVEDAPPRLNTADASAAAAAAADDEADDDEHNFATSAVSESAPCTILSPPPPPRAITPVQREESNISSDAATLPKVPTRAPPTIPVSADKGASQPGSSWLLLSPVLSATSPPLPALSFPSHGPRSCVSSPSCSVSLSGTEDDEDVDMDYEAFLLPPRHIDGHNNSRLPAAAGSSSKEVQEHHDHFIATLDSSFPHTNSTSTLVPGGRLGDLADELGWMATAIQE